MYSKIMSERESWKFIQEQAGGCHKWTRDAVESGWRCRLKTAEELKEDQRDLGALHQAHQDSLPH